jgi:signal transduction histidine kinase
MERRLARVAEAARALVLGGPAGRLPVTGRADEFDRLVEVFNEALARIEALLAAQRRVTDDIAHDLRSPLSRLRQRLEAALARARDPAADEGVLAAAIAELDAVLATFTALLRIARAESGALAVSFADLDLTGLVAGVAEVYAPVAEEAGRPFRQDLAPGLRLRGDAALLRQALANLLDNALQHGAGAVAVTLEAGPVVTVADEGPGVPEAEREAVLRRFHRLDASRGTPGSGLGLALVAAAAVAHGGRVALLPARPDGRGLRAVLDLRPGSA